MKHAIIVFFSFLVCGFTMADSPLTSTQFSGAFSEHSIIQTAVSADHIINDELCAYLIDATKPIDVKMGIINALGWNFNGQDNSYTFFQYLKKNRKYKDKEVFRKKGKDFELLSYAYLLAMDNYFEVSSAMDFANIAAKKNPKSQTIQFIKGLIAAQDEMAGNWCTVYRLVNTPRIDQNLDKDFSASAIELIFEYINDYSSYCNGSEVNEPITSEMNTDVQNASANLVGVWQDMPIMASGWSNNYQFYKGGHFNYNHNQMACDDSVRTESGLYMLKKNKLILSFSERTVLVGAKLEPSTGSCGTEMELVGGEIQVLAYTKKKKLKFSPISTDEEHAHLQSMSIGKGKYYKMMLNPEEY